MNNRHLWQLKKIKILWAILELPAKQQGRFGQFEVNGLNWQCFLAGSFKTAPRILIFSIVMGADYPFYVKSIATWTLTSYGYIILILASVMKVI
jgi:hypothetical protein